MKKVYILTILIVFLFSFLFVKGDFSKYRVDFSQVNFFEYNNVAVTSDGLYCFIPDSFNDRLIRINLSNFSVDSISVDDNPVGVYLSKDDTVLAVLCAGTVGLSGDKIDLVKVYDPTLSVFSKVEGDFNFGYYNNVVFSPDGIYGFVASNNTGYIYSFDVYSGEIVASVYVGLNVNTLTISPDGSELAVTYNMNGFTNVALIDVDIDDLGVSLDVGTFLSTGSSFFEKNNILFSNDGKYLIFPSDSNNKLIIFDASSGNVYKEISASGGIVRIFKSNEENMLYATIPSSNSILYLNLKDFSYFEKNYSLYISEDSRLTYVPITKKVFIAATGSNKLIEVDPVSGDEIEEFDVPASPTALCSDYFGNRFVLLSMGDNALEVFKKSYEYVLSYMRADDTFDTGFSFINFLNGITSHVTFTPFDKEGNSQGSIPFNISYFSQYVRSWISFNEGGTLPYPFDGWLKVSSDDVPLKGFSMVYRKDENEMDGYSFSRPSKEIYIPSVLRDNLSETEIFVVNPNSGYNQVKLTLYKSDGTYNTSQVENLSPNERLDIQNLGNYFNISEGDLENGGFLKIEAEKPVVALMKVGDDDGKLSFINFVSKDKVYKKGILPHFAVGDGWESYLSLSNLSSKSQDVWLEIYNEDGNLIVEKRFLLTGYSSIYESLKSILNLQDDSTLTTGWIEVRGNENLIGNLFFTYNGALFTQLPLEYRGSTQFIISHLAQSDYYFTGIAFVNDSFDETPLKISFYSEDGSLILNYNLTELPNRDKFVRLLSVDPFDILDQIGGFIIINSERPVYSYAVFGNFEKFISAIPSQR